jgi:small ubiquitin-related modifier
MAKLKRSYADRIGAPVTSLRFLFDGRRVNDDDSPKSVCSYMYLVFIYLFAA